jgi:outer membrane biogenesis lipoprotein LolB
MTTGARRARPFAVLVVLLCGACAGRAPLLPVDAGVPYPEFARAHAEASSACAGVRTFTAEITLAGRAGDQALRGRLFGGFEQPASMRLEGLAPFGGPIFILAAGPDGAVLYLPRDARVLRGATAADVLDAITGVSLGPAELPAVLPGGVTPAPGPAVGRLHGNGLVGVDLEGGATVFLEPSGGSWRPRAARRAGWTVEYAAFGATFPSEVLLRSTTAPVEIVARVAQFEANTPIDPAAFRVEVPAGTAPITLGELRAAGPLRDLGDGTP